MIDYCRQIHYIYIETFNVNYQMCLFEQDHFCNSFTFYEDLLEMDAEPLCSGMQDISSAGMTGINLRGPSLSEDTHEAKGY